LREKNVAILEIRLPSSDLAKIIKLSLKPELDTKTQMTVEDNVVTLILRSNTVATLRALFNSYLRWIGMIQKLPFVTDA